MNISNLAVIDSKKKEKKDEVKKWYQDWKNYIQSKLGLN
jgi:hypothetical protein